MPFNPLKLKPSLSATAVHHGFYLSRDKAIDLVFALILCMVAKESLGLDALPHKLVDKVLGVSLLVSAVDNTAVTCRLLFVF